MMKPGPTALCSSLAIAMLALASLTSGCTMAGGSGGDDPDSSADGTGGSSAAGGTGAGGSGVGGGPGSGGGPGLGGTGAGGRGVGGGPGSGGRGVGGGSGVGGAGATGFGGQPAVLRIMPLGDSITQATCWRAVLWQQLNQAGFQGRFDFVGSSVDNGGCTPTGADANNEGHSSCLVTEIVNNVSATARGCNTTLTQLTPALATDRADVVLMHFGTNDVWNNIKAGPILTAYGTLVDSLRAVNPRVVVLVAQIIPMNVTAATCAGCSCANCAADIPTLNTMITSWAASKSTATSPIIPVDQYSGFNATAGMDTRDGVHPNDSGSAKMAARWLTALQSLF